MKRVIALHAQEDTAIGQQAQEAAIDELYGLGYDYRKTFDTRIEAVKLEGCGRGCAAVFRKSRVGHVVAGE